MSQIAYDPEADILYVSLRDGMKIAGQKVLDDLRIIDSAEDGAVVGVEFICASGGIDLSDVPFAESVEKLIEQSGQSFKIFA